MFGLGFNLNRSPALHRLQGTASPLNALRSAMAVADTYVVGGGSNRDHTDYNTVAEYYEELLTPLNITVVEEAQRGITAATWAANTAPAKMSNAIAAIPNTGATTVLEFSFGINDYLGGLITVEQLTASWTLVIDALYAAKPDLTIFFASPPPSAADDAVLNAAYAAIGEQYGLHVVDVYSAMIGVYDWNTTNEYFANESHPNFKGNDRMLNVILSEVLASSQLSLALMPFTQIADGTNAGLTLRLGYADEIIVTDPIADASPYANFSMTSVSDLYTDEALSAPLTVDGDPVRGIADLSGNGRSIGSTDPTEANITWNATEGAIDIIQSTSNALELDVSDITGTIEFFALIKTTDIKFLLISNADANNWVGLTQDGNSNGPNTGFGSPVVMADNVDITGTQDDLHAVWATGSYVVAHARDVDVTGVDTLLLFEFKNYKYAMTGQVKSIVVTPSLTDTQRTDLVTTLGS